MIKRTSEIDPSVKDESFQEDANPKAAGQAAALTAGKYAVSIDPTGFVNRSRRPTQPNSNLEQPKPQNANTLPTTQAPISSTDAAKKQFYQEQRLLKQQQIQKQQREYQKQQELRQQQQQQQQQQRQEPQEPPREKTQEDILAEERQKAKDIAAYKDQIRFSVDYHDDYYVYRHVKLPKLISRWLPHFSLLSEPEWRALGVEQSSNWEHYMIHAPEPHILLFRQNIEQYRQKIKMEEEMRRKSKRELQDAQEETEPVEDKETEEGNAEEPPRRSKIQRTRPQ